MELSSCSFLSLIRTSLYGGIMINYLEISERALKGRKMSKNDWDFLIVEKAMKLVDKYSLSWNPELILEDNPELADRLYNAGRELLLDTGIYYLSEGTVLELSAEEIDSAAKAMNKSFVMGEGEQAYTLHPRKPLDERPPAVWAGNPGAPTPERVFKATVKSWTKEPVVDLITCGSLIDVDGVQVRSGEVSELYASKRELSILKEVREECGRPGIGMLGAESSVTEIGDLASAHPELLRPCDSHLVAMYNELMIDRGNMLRAANSVHYGMANASLATVMVGGLAGDAPGAAVVQIASFLAANIICLADYHLCHPIHIRYVATSARGCMWLQSMVCQAFARNAPAIIVGDIYPKSGAMTKEVLYEVAANAVTLTVAGGHLEGVGSADGSVPHGTGIEVRVMGETGHAVTGQRIDFKEGNRIILELLSRYEFVFEKKGGNPGLPFDEAYDMDTCEPKAEWLSIYEEVKAELADIGLKL